ncbi:MAG: MBL fold metallo-hydrolase [Pseudoxanthomonas sp.]
MYTHGIHTLDTGFQRPRFDAAYLVVENDRGAFVDCGTSHALPRLLAALGEAGLAPADVDFLILTHVHLDHAGGAGALMRALPNARLVVHPRGARHMIDPAALVAGATAVYGEAEMARSYGEIVPVPAERVSVAEDGYVVDLAGRPLLCIDTPGHARHHLAVYDARAKVWITGDSFGLSYRELDTEQGAFILPTSSPVQFEPEAMKHSIARMLEQRPEGMLLTHYGRVGADFGQVRKLAGDLCAQIDAMVELARAADDRADRHRRLLDALSALYLRRTREHGVVLADAQVLDLLGMDIELNAQGLACWLDRDRR